MSSSGPLQRCRRPTSRHDDDQHVIRSGSFKGKKIELASTGGVDLFRDIADRFMSRVFDLEPGDYLITDESSLADFMGVGNLELDELRWKIHQLYGVDVSAVEGDNLLQIFSRIATIDPDEV